MATTPCSVKLSRICYPKILTITTHPSNFMRTSKEYIYARVYGASIVNANDIYEVMEEYEALQDLVEKMQTKPPKDAHDKVNKREGRKFKREWWND